MTLAVNWARVQLPQEQIDAQAFAVGLTLMTIGYPKVETAADVAEVHARACFYDRLFEPLLKTNDGRNLNTLDFWKSWSGVSINAKKETRTQYLKRMTTSAMQDIDYAIRKEL